MSSFQDMDHYDRIMRIERFMTSRKAINWKIECNEKEGKIIIWLERPEEKGWYIGHKERFDFTSRLFSGKRGKARTSKARKSSVQNVKPKSMLFN